MMRRNQARLHAFTLIELLVSTAVGVVMFALMAGVLSAVSEVTSRTERNDRALSDGWNALELLGYDVRGILNRADVPWKPDGLGFFTGRPAWDGGRGVSAVVYRFDPQRGLVRSSTGVAWEGGGALPFSQSFPEILPSGEVVGENILAWDVAYVDSNTGGQFRAGDRPANIAGIIVTAVVLDRDFRTRLAPAELASLVEEFSAVEPPSETASEWTRKADALAASSGTFSTLRVIQKTYSFP